MLILEQFFEVVDDPVEVYQRISAFLQEKLQPVTMGHVCWATDPKDILHEVQENYNKSCGLSLTEVSDIFSNGDGDWLKLLSKTERDNYANYLEKLEMTDIPTMKREARGVCVAQNPDVVCMSGSAEALPAFTRESTKRIMMTNKDRWILALEKLAISGFPVHKAGS